MPDYKDFDTLKSLTRITGTLVNRSPLRVGVGAEPPLGSPVDMIVIRFAGRPYIPGSSLKGAFRAFVERAATSMGYKIHSPWDSEESEREAKSGDFCPVCGIFGSTHIASHVRIYDALPKSEARTFLKTGVGIDREFGAVRPGVRFTEEFVEPGVEWGFRMDVINIDVFPKPNPNDPRTQLLRVLFDALREGSISVGARKTVGAGLISLKEAKWEVYRLKSGRFELTSEGVLC